LIIELDLCGKLIDKDTVKTKVELDKAAQLARHTLAEVRKSVREIMPVIGNGTNGIFAIEELIRDFEKNTKIIVKLKVSEQKYKLSPTVEATLYRTVQEALTNSAKYGQADNIIIQLDYRNSKVELVIKDNGLGCDYITKVIGLKTMEDRINVLGGQISFSTNNGFIIKVVIPVEV
jgi:signal transduction histidine kinase